MSAPVFGRLLTAMVTPMTSDRAVDLRRTGELAHKLVEEQNNDGIVVNGTTGESPTTTDSEKAEIVKAVVEAVGSDAAVVAGVGTNDTAHTIELAHQAAEAGADGLLVVTPYYSKPSQAGIIEHFTAVADATDLPIMLYDIPGRTGTPIETKTLIELADHARIVAVKDAKGDLFAATELMETTDLAWYSGDDPLNLSWLAAGATGFISVIGHVAATELKALRDAFDAGDLATARTIAVRLAPLQRAMGRLGGVAFAKAALRLRGVEVGAPRLPIIEPTPAELDQLEQDLQDAGV